MIDIGSETVLLVEDEEMVRHMSRQMLETCGYTVIEAGNGIEALSQCESLNQKVDLLMTDVVMPTMGGRELAERITQYYPNIRVLFTSGYTDDAIIRQGMLTEEMNFIQKPFTYEMLAKKVRDSLDATEVSPESENDLSRN
jgi:CheY-like chemotaxis protein